MPVTGRFTEETIDNTIGRCSCGDRTKRRPIWNEEAACLGFDIDPVVRITRPFKSRDEGPIVVLEVGTGATVLGDETDYICLGPRTVSGVVKGEEELEVETSCCLKSQGKRCIVGIPAVGDVQGKGVKVGIDGQLNVVLPV